MLVSIHPFRFFPMVFASLITLLLLSNEPAHAEWVAFNDNAGMTVYANPDTIRRKGNLVKMWVQYDYKTIQTVAGFPYLSQRTQQQFDCAKERYRFRSSAEFSGNMGGGESVHSKLSEGKWEPVPPDSVAEALWKYACGKK
jgi:hypothetical protein